MTTLDARGVSCPEPLLMLKSALKNETSIELLVDRKNAYENCENYAKKLGFIVEFEKSDGTYRMQIKGKNE